MLCLIEQGVRFFWVEFHAAERQVESHLTGGLHRTRLPAPRRLSVLPHCRFLAHASDVCARATAEFVAFLLSFKQAAPHRSEERERPGRVSQEHKDKEEDGWKKIDRGGF